MKRSGKKCINGGSKVLPEENSNCCAQFFYLEVYKASRTLTSFFYSLHNNYYSLLEVKYFLPFFSKGHIGERKTEA